MAMRLALRYLGDLEGRDSVFRGTRERLVPGEEVSIPPQGLTLGRSSRSDLRVASGQVARAHVRVVPDEDGLRVIDLGSTNGTQVRRRDPSRARLREGDGLTLAERFEFEVVVVASSGG